MRSGAPGERRRVVEWRANSPVDPPVARSIRRIAACKASKGTPAAGFQLDRAIGGLTFQVDGIYRTSSTKAGTNSKISASKLIPSGCGRHFTNESNAMETAPKAIATAKR